MSIKPIRVDGVEAYEIPLILRDGTEHRLKLREGFTMSNEDADDLMKFGLELFQSVGKKLTEAGVEKALTEEQIERLPDQERAAYLDKVAKATEGKEIVTESLVIRKIVSKAYDVTEEWLYKNTNPEVLKAIFEHVQEWIGLGTKKPR